MRSLRIDVTSQFFKQLSDCGPFLAWQDDVSQDCFECCNFSIVQVCKDGQLLNCLFFQQVSFNSG